MSQIQLFLERFHRPGAVLPDGLPASTAPLPPPTQAQQVQSFLDPTADPSDLRRQRWGVVTPTGERGRRLLSAVEPLVRLRQEEQGREVRRYEAPPDQSEPEARRWIAEHLRGADAPRYLLLLGDLHELSAELQQALATDHFPGRLAFDTEDELGAYVEKVRRSERAPLESPRALFFTALDGTLPPAVGRRDLVTPTARQCREGIRDDGLAAEVFEVEGRDRRASDDLLRLVEAPRPSVLLSLSHGIGAPEGGWATPEQQREMQGALSLGSGRLLAPDDVARRSFLPGGAWFCFACFGAGTPARSAYRHWLEELRAKGEFGQSIEAIVASLSPRDRPFIARTPRAALSNPRGPLAVVGHLDVAWSSSFQGAGAGAALATRRFFHLIEGLLRGRRAGPAVQALLHGIHAADGELTHAYDEAVAAKGSAEEVHRLQASVWLLRNDLRAYVLLGDPAARLAVPRDR